MHQIRAGHLKNSLQYRYLDELARAGIGGGQVSWGLKPHAKRGVVCLSDMVNDCIIRNAGDPEFFFALNVAGVSVPSSLLELLVKKLCTTKSVQDYMLESLLAENTRDLCLRGCHLLTDTGLQHVASKCPNLRAIDLSNIDANNCSPLGVRAILSSCTMLQCLKLGGSYQPATICDDDGVIKMLGAMKSSLCNLKVLCIRNSSLGSKGLTVIGANCPSLETLDLRSCKSITSEGLVRVVSMCESLKALDLQGCYAAVSDAMIGAVAEAMSSRLEELNLAMCRFIGDASLRSLAAHAPRLRVLRIKGCRLITSQGVIALAAGCNRLEALNISGCYDHGDSSANSVNTLIRRNPNLRAISMMGVLIDPSTISNLVIHCPCLALVDMSNTPAAKCPETLEKLSKRGVYVVPETRPRGNPTLGITRYDLDYSSIPFNQPIIL